MTKKLVAFRIEESLWEQFLKLVDESGRSAQDVLRECVRTCLEARSTDVKPLSGEKSARDLSNELRLRSTLVTLRGCIKQGNYVRAEDRFGDLIYEMRRVRDPILLEDAQVVAAEYLKWMDEHNLKTGGYKRGYD